MIQKLQTLKTKCLVQQDQLRNLSQHKNKRVGKKIPDIIDLIKKTNFETKFRNMIDRVTLNKTK